MSTKATTPVVRSTSTPANAVGGDRAAAKARTAAAKARGAAAAATQNSQVLTRMEQAITAEVKPATRKPRTVKPKAAPAVKAPKAAPAPVPVEASPCRCNCGNPTKRPSATYLPGHDARHAGDIGRSVADLDLEQAAIRIELALGTPALQAKATRVAENTRRNAAIKAAKAAAKAALAVTLAKI